MVTAGDFRNGVTFEMDGNVYSIIEFQHVKPCLLYTSPSPRD